MLRRAICCGFLRQLSFSCPFRCWWASEVSSSGEALQRWRRPCRWRGQWNKSASPLRHCVTRLLRLLGCRWLRRCLGCCGSAVSPAFIRAALRVGSPLPLEAPIRVISSPTLIEPGLFGIFRPVLLLPDGIADRLTPAQFQAILAHELCHLRRRDNLAAATHMVVEAIFWFHPLVWWIGARLIEERERACDEEVLQQGSQPEVYAEGILRVCKLYLESPLSCSSGVTGADLKQRIEAIMTHRILPRLTLTRKLLVASAGIAAVTGPIVLGIVNSPPVRAQAGSASLRFEVASIKPAKPDPLNRGFRMVSGGSINASSTTLKQLVAFAYDVQDSQISGGPSWISSEKYDILAQPVPSEVPADVREMSEDQRKRALDRMRQRLRSLLAERFQLTVSRDTKELPAYALRIGKNGSKLQEFKEGEHNLEGIGLGKGQLTLRRSTMQMLATVLSKLVGGPVQDQTGLTGTFDGKLEWTPEPGEPSLVPETTPTPTLSGRPSLFTAVQEQLGLKLESTGDPGEMIVVDKVEKPSEN
ncbi:MAG: hypothetical protein DMG06_05710 [Acidobacteria bacterium]|nr:MAG: hypothetical protein DMG06_05710 [Acidobacteriota bacterium]